LKKVGRNYRGLCPFHSERSPSFYVSPERQSYHCFGCGAGGNAFTFIMAYEKVDFPEAVKILAKRLGIKVAETFSYGNQPLYEVLELVARFFEENLTKSIEAQSYLKKRGLSRATIKRFRLGFAPAGNLLRGAGKKLGVSEEHLLRAGLLFKKENGLIDYFRERIVFPIFSPSGKIIGFSGRVLDDSEPKYLNSPDSPVFHKGEILYGFFQAKGYIREEVPILVEGNFDLLSLVERGINNVVAPLGTALTVNQALLLRRYNRQVFLCFDGDEAGEKACRRTIEVFLRAGVEPQIMKLPEGRDPDSYIREAGIEGFSLLMRQAVDFVDFIVGMKRGKTVGEKRGVISELAGLVRIMSDETARELFANKIAQMFQINRHLILSGDSGERLGPDSGKEQRGVPVSLNRGIEEKFVAAASQDKNLAQIARELKLSEMVEDECLKRIARLIENHYDKSGFGLALLIDMMEDEADRSRIAQWAFTETNLPKEEEFRIRLQRFRARWLHRQIEAAHRAGKEKEVESLAREREVLLKDVVKKEG
ncbi:MAG: DNA primase, partial [candidate division WOR-3 bacterium]